ncbi:MAG: methylmalonyl-CoA mutase, partial [Candidatus Eremiobacteraeota bacterium]|nr:methylmalonyl-CoA mutase [Candidatus Eremiobacteraeota bacterium]
ETLTNELIEAARATIAEIDALGGSIAAIESGWMQGRIGDSAYLAQQAIERKEAIVVGVNAFVDADTRAATPALQRIDERVEREQMERLQRFRSLRDGGAVAGRLASVRNAAAGSENLMPHFLEAVDAGATLGEICNVLREVFGTYHARESLA